MSIIDIRKTVKVKLAGEEFEMSPSFIALREIELSCKRGFHLIAQDYVEGTTKFHEVIVVIYSGLIGSGITKYSCAQVGDIMLKEGVHNFAQIAFDYLDTFLDPEEKKKDSAVKKKKKRTKKTRIN